jgi:3-hydroxyacyl-CoA dehydrogenase/enoyl-CoA hydratase/3-hydroxybutyryl-CoA epimerase
MSYAKYSKDSDGIVTITFDNPDSKVNVMNTTFIDALGEALDQLDTEIDDVKGVIVASGKDTFFAGGDLDQIVAVTKDTVDEYFGDVMRVKSMMRRIEKLGRPVVAAINGAALGGGYEICQACHHRVALDSPKVVVGLPEVTLGLLPGGGGVVRLVRMLGLKKALPLLLEGTRVAARDAAEMGLVDELAADKDELIEKAREWIHNNPDVVRPWDVKGFQIPGGGMDSPVMKQFVTFSAAGLKAKTRGLYPAPEAILSAAVEGMQVDIDSADRIESRYLAYLSTTQVAKNMITTFYQMNRLKGGESRPQGFEKSSVSRLGILGAGMMGSGIAYSASKVGIDVVLKDVSMEGAEKGKAYSDKVGSKLISMGRMTEEEKDGILSRIKATTDVKDLEGCDLVVEAVFENRDLKATVTEEAEAVLDDSAIFASNTSTLPITGLAEASKRPENFVGLHFFSPVDRMKLVEIICGKKTSDETLARAYDFVTQLRKVPIVVNDSRDFYTSRVFESGCDEGAWMLSDGIDPARIENLAQQVGMPVGPLASVDAVSQQLVYLVKHQAQKDFEAEGRDFPAADQPPFQWITRMVDEFDRKGKAYGGGYYEYLKDDDGRRHKKIWGGLRDAQPAPTMEISDQDIKDRVLYRQAIEAVRCLEEGVLRSVVDCNIGSMLGIGYPAYTGGQLQFINACGVAVFAERAKELADKFGDRFSPPQLLLDMAANGEVFE